MRYLHALRSEPAAAGGRRRGLARDVRGGGPDVGAAPAEGRAAPMDRAGEDNLRQCAESDARRGGSVRRAHRARRLTPEAPRDADPLPSLSAHPPVPSRTALAAATR